MGKDVFLSVGGTANDAQEEFVQAVETRLRAEGLVPNTVGRNTFSVDAPLKTVEYLMDRCVGTVVLALERTHFPTGTERRGGEKEKVLSNTMLATPWNQIEAAMAYSRGLPLLVIVEEGVKHEGLLEPGYDWYVQTVPLNKDYLNSTEFNGVLASWKTKVSDTKPNGNRSKEEKSIEKMSVAQLIGSLKPAQLWSAVLALCAVIGVAFSLGANLIP
ncbi:hypothetical protein CCR90_08740 [Rhodovulum sulfidophilum]|uniref:hypothetical protein n=1 Tax=Rhodovulum sulfidophilum TaxID=35806 RepID=UPI0019138FBF|nr:hypothetical protein [Rhodovulum sulfidophilum]MBK5923864.1 hypothetical protein [Rhodovulum sulfidophilum]